MSRGDSINPLRSGLGWIAPASVVVALVGGVFLLVPLAAIMPIAFTSSEFLDFPPGDMSARWFGDVLSDPNWRAAGLLSLRVGLGAAAVATIVGTAAALGLKRVSIGMQRVIRVAALMPLTLPYVVYALGLHTVLGELTSSSGTTFIVLGHAVLAFPLAFMIVSASQNAFDDDIRRASSAMGASWWTTVARIEVPLLRRSILAAFIFSFAFSFDEVVIALYLAAPGEPTLPLLMFSSVQESVTPATAAVSVMVIGVALVLAAVGGLLIRTKHPQERGRQ